MIFIMLINVKMPTITDILTFISIFIMLINVKMPTIVGILTFMSRINTTSESKQSRKSYYYQHFNSYEQLKFDAQ